MFVRNERNWQLHNYLDCVDPPSSSAVQVLFITSLSVAFERGMEAAATLHLALPASDKNVTNRHNPSFVLQDIISLESALWLSRSTSKEVQRLLDSFRKQHSMHGRKLLPSHSARALAQFVIRLSG